MDTPKWEDTEPVSWDDTAPIDDVPSFDETESLDTAEEMSAPAAFIQRAGQSASMGWGDEAVGRIGAAYDYLGGKLGMRGEIGWDDAVKTRVDAIRNRDAEASEAHPNVALAGDITGAALTALAPAGALAKGAGWAKNVGAGMLTGAGQSEADSLEELAEDTAEGGALGFGAGALFGGAGKIVNKAAGGLKKLGEKQAVDSLGPMLADEKALANKGLRDKLGRELLDEGVTTFGSSPATQAERLVPLLSKKGKVIGDIRDSVDKQAAKFAKAGDDMAADARRVDFDNALAKRAERATKAAKGGSLEEKKMAELVGENVESLSEIPMRSLKDTATAIRKLDDQIPWHKPASEWTPSQRALAAVRNNLAKQSDGKIRGFTNRFDEYQGAKDTFGLFKEGEKIAEKAAMRGKGDLAPGLKDLVTAGGSNKNLVDKIVDATTLKFVRDRGHSMIAKTADTAYKLLSTSPEVMGKYNGPLTQALKRGNKAFFTTHMMLMNQDPEYAEMVQQMTTEDTDG